MITTTLNSGAPSSLPVSTVLDELGKLLPRYVVLPKHAAETLALWIVHTYCFQFRDVSTYLGIESPVKRCGKTTLLGVLGKPVSRPVVASNISPSAFFRVIEEMKPTLLIDEADTFLDGNDELRGILNAGYHEPNAYVIRVRPDGKRRESTLAKFSCWCPKVIAAIGHLPETLADRCIVIRMERKRGDEECERLRNLESEVLRQQCIEFAATHQAAITAAKPVVPNALNDRAADIWEPLLAIADIAGGDWPQRARTAAVALTAAGQEGNPAAALLFDIGMTFYSRRAERLLTKELLAELNDPRFAGRPWTEGLRSKPATEMWLAEQLRPFGVRPKLLRVGERVGKGYDFCEMVEPLNRYVPESELENWKKENVT